MSGSDKREDTSNQELSELSKLLPPPTILSMVLKSAIELDIIDIIYAAGEGVFLSPSEIATTIRSKNPGAPLLLDRILRYLASNSILHCSVRTKEDGEMERVYAAQPVCKLLAKNQDGRCTAHHFLLQNDKVFLESCFHLSDAILEGGIPFERAHGMKVFEYAEKDNRFNSVLNRAMSSNTPAIMKRVLDFYKGFEGINVLVDVGGGIGDGLGIITSNYPQIKGINFDLPHVLAGAPAYPGVVHIEGNMFQSVPKGDAILMKWILHDWDDDDCLKILKNCFKSLPNGGKVIVFESILPETPENSFDCQKVYMKDVVLLAHFSGGKERTQKEFQALALKSGFSTCEVICCAHGNWVMEFHKSINL